MLVATPIGNLGDLSPRAVEALAGADVVACEDTRRTGRLLQRAGIAGAKLLTVNDHTEASRVGRGAAASRPGERVAVVTDAGTPGISDPGERLVRAAIGAGHPVEVVPGPSAVVAALVVSGLPTGRFVFEGFLPRRGSARAERLAALAEEERTIVLYEAPHRAGRTLADLAAAFGPARRVLDRPRADQAARGGVAGHACPRRPTGWPPSLPGASWRSWWRAPAAPGPAGRGRAAVGRPRGAELAPGPGDQGASAVVARRFGVPRRSTYALALRLRETPR